jgi:N-acetylglucosaminyl-diphospho-decaprenol L-rhamnosyltransferase
MTCDAVVVTFNSAEKLSDCLARVLPQIDAINGAVFVVDNASNDQSRQIVREQFPDAVLIQNESNRGYGAAINRALDRSEAAFVLCLNPDVRLEDGALDALMACAARHDDCIAAAPRLTYPDGSFHPVCRRYPTLWRNYCHVSGLAARVSPDSAWRHWLSEAQHDGERDVDMVSGACVLFRRAYLDRIGGFDHRIFLYEEESDVFLPARKLGGRAYYCPEAYAVHDHGEQSASNGARGSAIYFRRRSKYFVFAKHYGINAARAAYWTDRLVLAGSWLRAGNAFKRNEIVRRLAAIRKAYDEAMNEMET